MEHLRARARAHAHIERKVILDLYRESENINGHIHII